MISIAKPFIVSIIFNCVGFERSMRLFIAEHNEQDTTNLLNTKKCSQFCCCVKCDMMRRPTWQSAFTEGDVSHVSEMRRGLARFPGSWCITGVTGGEVSWHSRMRGGGFRVRARNTDITDMSKILGFFFWSLDAVASSHSNEIYRKKTFLWETLEGLHLRLWGGHRQEMTRRYIP